MSISATNRISTKASDLPYSLQSILLQGCSTIPDRTQVSLCTVSIQHVLFINIRCTCRFSQSQDDTFQTIPSAILINFSFTTSMCGSRTHKFGVQDKEILSSPKSCECWFCVFIQRPIVHHGCFSWAEISYGL